MTEFRNINVNAATEPLDAGQTRLRRFTRFAQDGAGPVGSAEEEMVVRMQNRLAASGPESASRAILQTYLEDAGSETMAEVTSPDRPELVPDLLLEGDTAVPDLQARSVAYQQSAAAVPIFGGRVVVDLDEDRNTLISLNGKLAPVPTGSPIATLSPAAAWQSLRDWGKDRGPLAEEPPAPPTLTWHIDEESDDWVLVYHFVSIPLSPPEEPIPDGLPFKIPEHLGCCMHAPRGAFYDYFVDAMDGAVRFYFSSSAALDIPVPMKGLDYASISRDFFGLQNASKFFLKDPLRNIATFDYANGDLDAIPPLAFPTLPIDHAAQDLANSRPEAVAAHFNAKLVYDFFNDVLKRDSVDDKGMQLTSVVNVYSSVGNPLPKPQWGNAVWWQSKMWYGQQGGQSFAKHLDIIAHELTHGVTETSSKLIYRRLSGALNESFSDIFGIAIANWWPGAPNPVATWNWQIGAGLGSGGGPIRDFANPANTGQPDHMSQYRPLPINVDQGGVHIYSGIHNRAVHLLMTGTDTNGDFTFPMSELLLLLYLTLTRLTPTSVFVDSRRTLENVVSAYYNADPATRQVRLDAIDLAFGTVGIV